MHSTARLLTVIMVRLLSFQEINENSPTFFDDAGGQLNIPLCADRVQGAVAPCILDVWIGPVVQKFFGGLNVV